MEDESGGTPRRDGEEVGTGRIWVLGDGLVGKGFSEEFAAGRPTTVENQELVKFGELCHWRGVRGGVDSDGGIMNGWERGKGWGRGSWRGLGGFSGVD